MDNLFNAPQYIKGAQVYLSASFTDAAGDLIDPTGVVLKYKIQNGTATTLTYGVDAALVKDSTGVYHCYITPSTAGVYYYRWEASGTTSTGAVEGLFVIVESKF